MKNSTHHCWQTSGVANGGFVGHNNINAYGIASFPPEKRENVILIVDGATNTIF